ncbi:hypothetical protein [Galbibacter sp. BG1]
MKRKVGRRKPEVRKRFGSKKVKRELGKEKGFCCFNQQPTTNNQQPTTNNQQPTTNNH